ncbi:MAG: extradiol ring-cleavage dioxygenase, partial [Gammaproteobacteria bacterium]|nr:extradiol ring-cleavage dioxygenase [Gammaproteobacteria bacterium]
MSLVFAGICSHAPGITGRARLADPALREPFYAAFRRLREQLLAARPDALVVVAAEHFANFFMNNMPSFAIGMADHYHGPIEDPEWLGIARRRIP